MPGSPSTAKEVQIDLLNFYAVLSAWAILFYDHLLQLGREVDLVWRQLPALPSSFPTILYLLTRLTFPVACLVNLDHDLKALQPATEWLMIASQCIIAVLGLRTYAIWEGNRLVLLILLCVGSSIPVTGILLAVTVTSGSHVQELMHAVVPFRSMLMSLMSLVFDSIVVVLTVGKSMQSRRAYHTPGGFLDTILRDGCIYFIALASTQLINVLCYWLAPRSLVGIPVPLSRATYFTDRHFVTLHGYRISVALTTRFTLNLRELHYARCRSGMMSTGTEYYYYMNTSTSTSTNTGGGGGGGGELAHLAQPVDALEGAVALRRLSRTSPSPGLHSGSGGG